MHVATAVLRPPQHCSQECALTFRRKAVPTATGVGLLSPERTLNQVVDNYSLQSLRDVGERHPEGLDGGERVLEVQRVRVVVDPAKLHHLKKKFEIGRQCSLQFCVVLLPSMPAPPITGFGVSAFELRTEIQPRMRASSGLAGE